MSALFLAVYGGCNWITARRAHVGSFFFEWERGIPFVPFMILPYLSIDLFFLGAPLLLRRADELRIFARRIATAIVIAGAFFLFVPLRFAFPRPTAAGWLGLIFDWFRAMDAPFNLFPSLHAALWVLLVEVYAEKLTGVVRVVVLGWFVLIALSPILTHQHHVIDIVGGFLLGLGCRFFLSPNQPRRLMIASTHEL